MTTMMMMDKTMVDALAAYTGTVTVCPSGRGKAPDAKRQRGRAQFQCVCGHAGTMAYPKLFQRLRVALHRAAWSLRGKGKVDIHHAQRKGHMWVCRPRSD